MFKRIYIYDKEASQYNLSVLSKPHVVSFLKSNCKGTIEISEVGNPNLIYRKFNQTDKAIFNIIFSVFLDTNKNQTVLDELYEHFKIGEMEANLNPSTVYYMPTGSLGKTKITWAKSAFGAAQLKSYFDIYGNAPTLKKKVVSKPTLTNKKTPLGKRFSYKPLSKYEGLEGKLPTRAGTTFVGVELELEQVEVTSHICSSWVQTEDGSLKDDGMEFYTVPIQFKYLEVELNRLFGSLGHAKVSSRCSTHVHINVRDFTLEELKTFTALYMIFEKSLYNFSGNRWNNIFCVPLVMNIPIVSKFFDYVDKQGIISTNSGSWYKYFGFNLSPIFGGESSVLGTIEFRHHVGSMNIKEIINWINLIVSLKITAKKLPYSELETHLKTMNTTSGYFWLAQHTFKDFAKHIVNQPTFKEDVEHCITMAKKTFIKSDKVNITIPYQKKGTLCVESLA